MSNRKTMNNRKNYQWESAVKRLIVSIAVVFAIIPLVLYLLFYIEEQKISMGAKAEIFAHSITAEINNNPDYWQFEETRFATLLRHRLHEDNEQEQRQLFDSNNKLVADNNVSLQPPLIIVEISVLDAGTAVGILKVKRSIRSILQKAALIFFFSSLGGMLVYLILHVFPLKVLRSAFKALDKEKEQATVTLQSIADAVITTDTSLQILSLNPAATELAGVQPATVLGEPINEHFKIIHFQTREKIEICLDDFFQTGNNPCSLQKQAILVRQEDGKESYVEITVSSLYDEQDALIGLVIALHDVTASRILETQLKDKVKELCLTVKYAGVGIAFVRNGVIQEANTPVSEMIGIPADSIVGQQVAFILTSFLGYTKPIEGIYEHLSKGKIFDIEHLVVRSDQKRVWIRLIGQAVDPKRLIETGSVWVTQDITQLKEQQADLQRAKFQAEEASRFKSEFLAHVNHELRNPLSGIIGMNRLVLQTGLQPDQHKNLTIIQDTAENLLLLINNLLDLSKIEIGAMELEEKRFRLNSVLDYVHNVVALRVKQKGLSLALSIAENVPQDLIGDELRLGQILLNLVGNAIKFTSTGGITISCEKILQTEPTIQLRFSVIDTGCGIAEPVRKKIFDAFVQESSSVARTHGGSGLGLSICKKLTLLMGGDIGLESEPGKGSIFSFTGWFRYEKQPVIESTDFARKMPKPKIVKPQHPIRILLVEDIPFIQTIAKLLLEEEDHYVQVAANGLEALAILAESSIDAIFMDIQMPGMDGLTATRLIRRCENEKNPLASENYQLLQAVSSKIYGEKIPIIGMTGNVTEICKLECSETGMVSCITKPFKRQEMYQALDAIYNELALQKELSVSKHSIPTQV